MKRIVDIYKRYKISGILLNLFGKFLNIFRIDLSLWILLSKELSESPKPNSQVEFRRLSMNDFLVQGRLNPSWFTQEKLCEMERSLQIEGNEAYGYFEGEFLACYGWISLKYWGLEKNLLLPSDGYLWDAYTHPNFRGRGLHKILSEFRYVKLMEAGKSRALTVVARYNHASLVGFLRAGFVPVARFIRYSINGGTQKSTLKYGK